jgi:hypothetical protein
MRLSLQHGEHVQGDVAAIAEDAVDEITVGKWRFFAADVKFCAFSRYLVSTQRKFGSSPCRNCQGNEQGFPNAS